MCTLEVQRPFFEWFFRKDYCFSQGLLSTDPGKCHSYGLWLPGCSLYIQLMRGTAVQIWKKICYGMFLGWKRLTFYTQKEDAGISWHIFRFHISCSRYTKYREWHPHPIIQNVGFTGPWPLGLSGATAYTPKHYMLFLYSSHPLSAHVGNTPYIAWNIDILFHNFIYFYDCHCWELQFMGSWLLKEWNLPQNRIYGFLSQKVTTRVHLT